MSANPIWDFASGLIKPITDLFAKAVLDKDLAAQLASHLNDLQFAVLKSQFDYQSQLLDAQKAAIVAEANSNSFLARTWRPITMLVFLALVVCDSFGWLPNKLAPQAWTLLQIGLGGYAIGRSVEKAAPAIAQALSK